VTILYVAFGALFGFVLSRSGAADYDFIQGMFLFTNFQLYGIIASAVVLTAPGLWLIQRSGRTFSGRCAVERKPVHRGTVIGGLLFGVGWSMAGMCPGPILVNIGEGKLYAFAALAGALTGAGLLGELYPRLQRALKMPALAVGPGEG
jgi:uncharacterized protein